MPCDWLFGQIQQLQQFHWQYPLDWQLVGLGKTPASSTMEPLPRLQPPDQLGLVLESLAMAVLDRNPPKMEVDEKVVH